MTNPDAECQTDPLEEAEYSHAEVDHNLCSEVTDDIKLSDINYKAQVEVGLNSFVRLELIKNNSLELF